MEIIINGQRIAMPEDAVAYKYTDPEEEARWIYDEQEAEEIEQEDSSLIVWPEED